MKEILIVKKNISLAFALLALCGCSFQRPASDADYGTMPTEKSYPVIENDIRDKLKDPDSAKFEHNGFPNKVYVNDGLINGGKVSFTGWEVIVLVNGKNGYGGYVGFQPWTCFLKNDSEAHCSSGNLEGNPVVHKVW